MISNLIYQERQQSVSVAVEMAETQPIQKLCYKESYILALLKVEVFYDLILQQSEYKHTA